jgi:hypothetical protein
MSKFVLAINVHKRLRTKTNSDVRFLEDGRDHKGNLTEVLIATEWEGNKLDEAEYTNLVQWFMATKDDPKCQEAYYHKRIMDRQPHMKDIAYSMLNASKISDGDALSLIDNMKAGNPLSEGQTLSIRNHAVNLLTHDNYKVRVLARMLIK